MMIFKDLISKNNFKIFQTKRVIGFERELIYQIVSNTKEYQEFIPFIMKSRDFNVNSVKVGGIKNQVGGIKNHINIGSGLEIPNGSSLTKNVELSVGFQGFHEKYVSLVTCHPSEFSVHAVVDQKHGSNLDRSIKPASKLFKSLESVWKIDDYKIGNRVDSLACTVDFSVSFEFHSILHAKLADLMFERTCNEMISLFENRAKKLYGPPSRPSETLL